MNEKRVYQILKKGEFSNVSYDAYANILSTFMIAEISFSETIERKFENGNLIVIKTIAKL